MKKPRHGLPPCDHDECPPTRCVRQDGDSSPSPCSTFLSPSQHGKYWHDLAQERISENARLRESVSMLSRLLRDLQYNKPLEWPKTRDVEHALRVAADILSNPINKQQRDFANRRIDEAQRALVNLTENGRNLDEEARKAINRARDEISLAETLIANQPSV